MILAAFTIDFRLDL